ncbi:MAG: hypothetical protein LBT43_01205 [Prevotella sp.]|jgi:hypothetical protein|nr:hypothetical protein [Prevotella sp.]
MFSTDDIGTRHYELQLDKCWQIYRKDSRKVSGLCHMVGGTEHQRPCQENTNIGSLGSKGRKDFEYVADKVIRI